MAKRKEAKVVKFVDPAKAWKKEQQAQKHAALKKKRSEYEERVRKREQRRADELFKKASREVDELGGDQLFSFDRKKRREKERENLGLRPAKNKKVPYKILVAQQKKNQQRDAKHIEEERKGGVLMSTTRKVHKSKAQRRQARNTGPSLNLHVSSNDIRRAKKNLRSKPKGLRAMHN
ncbi:MAG: hypothetical protein MHM6MM_001020 [Cercozoa sp. M6MM]